MKNNIKKIFSIFLLWFYSMGILFSQPTTFTFTEEEVIELRNKILQLEYSDSLNTEIIGQLKETINLYQQDTINDSLIINLKDQEIDLLNKRIDLYKDLVKEVEPKWYESKYIYFLYGMGTILASSWVVGNVAK